MEKESKTIIIKSDNYKSLLNKSIMIKFIGGRELIGKLINYDELENLLIEREDDEKSQFICFGRSIYGIIPIKKY